MTDLLGTPIAALNLASGLVGEQLRTPYGQARYSAAAASGGGMHTTFGFTGQREDTQALTQAPGSSGLYYFNARYYDPTVGRFTSADPTRPDLGSPWGTDAYGYVGGQVEQATDPSGRAEDPYDGAGGSFQGGNTSLASEGGGLESGGTGGISGHYLPTLGADGLPAVTEGNIAYTPSADGSIEVTTYSSVGTVESQDSYDLQTDESGWTKAWDHYSEIADPVDPEAEPLNQSGYQGPKGPGNNGTGTEPSTTEPTTTETQPTTGSTEPTVDIYRGTDNGYEIASVKDSQGYAMSDAAREAYLSARSGGASVQDALQEAQAASEAADEARMQQFNNSRDQYVQAHGSEGAEFTQKYGPKSMISFTTDPVKALTFGDTIYKATVPASAVFPQTLPGANEAEVLVLHMIRVEPVDPLEVLP